LKADFLPNNQKEQVWHLIILFNIVGYKAGTDGAKLWGGLMFHQWNRHSLTTVRAGIIFIRSDNQKAID
jgi:hypothetical protein